jgi:hypothetical protein
MEGHWEGPMRSLGYLTNNNDFVPADSQPIVFAPELYIRSRAVVSRLVAGETLVLPVRGDIGDLASFYTLNGTATTIWEALEKPRSLTEICDVIDRKYEIGKERAEEDLVLFVREMCSLGLVKVAVDPEKATEKGDEIACNNPGPA